MGQPLPSTTPEYKKKVLLHNNIDPEQFDLTDAGDVVPKVVQQPTISESSEPVSTIAVKPASQSSATGAFGRSALASTAPTLGGLGAAGIASLLLAPETGGLSLLGLLGVGAAGLGGSLATGKVQDALLPDSAKQQLAADQAEHPIASTVGGLAPSALMFNPVKGVMNLPAVGKAAFTKVFSGGDGTKALTSSAEQLLKNTAVNVGMNVGSGIAAQGINGQPLDAGGLGIDALSGLLFNEPTSIGKAILPYLGHAQPQEQVQPVQQQQAKVPAIQVKPLNTPNIRTGDETRDVSAFVRKDALNKEGKDFSSQKKRDAMHNYAEEFVSDDILNRMDDEGGGIQVKPSEAELQAFRDEQRERQVNRAESSPSDQVDTSKLTYEPQDLVSKRLNEQSVVPTTEETDRARNLKEQQDTLRDSQDEVLQEQIRQSELQRQELQRQNDLKEQQNLEAAKANRPTISSGLNVGRADFNKQHQINQDIQTIKVKPDNHLLLRSSLDVGRADFNKQKQINRDIQAVNDNPAVQATDKFTEDSAPRNADSFGDRYQNEPASPLSQKIDENLRQHEKANPELYNNRIRNNYTAPEGRNQKWKLPSGVTPEKLNAFLKLNGKDSPHVQELYNELVRLNPSLKDIRTDMPYEGPFTPEKDIVHGVASGFSGDDIKYFVEQGKGTGANLKEGLDYAAKNDLKYIPRPHNDNDPYLLRNATPQYKKAVMELAAKRGITLREAKGLVNPATGKEVLGKVNVETRVADINPNRAEHDTPVHEVYHGYVNDLLNSEDLNDRNLAKRGIDIFGGDMQHAEEALTTRIGVDGAERIKDSLDGSALKQFSSWFKDFTSRMKVNLGVANDEDVVRHLGARLQHDAPYGTRSELGARYTGFQPGFGSVEGRKLYTTKDEVKDKNTGEVKIGKGSTVTSSKLDAEGVRYQNKSSYTPNPKDLKENQEVFNHQNDNGEQAIGSKNGVWNTNQYRYRLENAGDILREFSKYPSGWFDTGYINEKINGIQKYIDGKDYGVNPTGERQRSIDKGDGDRIKAVSKAYDEQPTINSNQEAARQLAISLANGDFQLAQRHLDHIKNVVKDGPTTKYQEESSKLKDNPNFRKWFGESKVVDKEGNPLVVYHGTGGDFNSFKASREGALGKGIYVSPNPEFASRYAMENQFAEKVNNGKVYPLYVKMENPLKVEKGGPAPAVDVLVKLGLSREKADAIHEKAYEEKGNLTNEIHSRLIKAGYDGIILTHEGQPHEIMALRPEQIKSTLNKGTFDPNNTDIRYQDEPSKDKEKKPLSIPLFKPELEKIRDNYGEHGKVVASALEDFYENFRHFKGEFTNDVVGKLRAHLNLLNPKELATQNNATLDKVLQYMDNVSDGIPTDVSLSPKEKEVEGIVRDSLAKMVEAKNTRPGLPDTTANEEYFPHVVSRKALNTLFNKPGTPEAKALIKEFFDYQKSLGHDEATAKENLEIFRKGYQSDDKNLAASFGPIDKSAGVGIPQSWREKNLIDRMSRFANRYARRIAYHDSIETNKPATEALTDPVNGIGNADVVRGELDNVAGKRENEEAKRNAVSGVIRAGMIGTLSGAKDFVTNLTLGLQHQSPMQALTSPFKAWSNIKENLADSFKEGVNRHNFASLEFGDGGIEDFTNLLRTTRDILNEVQGRNFLEKITRATAFGQGKFLAMDNLLAASKGRVSGQGAKFLEDFASKGIDWKQYREKGEFPTDVLNKIAARYVESVQGTYDSRGLPAVAQKGSLAPILSLAKWNVEKMNNFVKHNIEPARNGNFTPLLMSTLGMLVGGEAIEKLVEEATGRKSKTATVAELKNAKNLSGPLAYKLAALSSMSGYAGIMGDITKSLLDKQMGNRAQGYTNPLVEGVSQGIDLMSDVGEAVKNGDLNIMPEVISKVLETYFQAYRLGLNQLSPDAKQSIDKSNKLRDLRVFKQTQGLPQAGVSTDEPNPFKDLDVKEFKETKNPQDAAKLLPGLIQKALKKANGNPEILKSELQKLKENSYQTMPSPDRMPITFMSYLETLRTTQGDDAATERLMDYMKNNAVNRAKSSLVPSL